MRKEYIIHFEHDKCTQCHGCEVACRSWRELKIGIKYRRVLNRWQGVYPAVKSCTVALSCLHCVEPDCVKSCPEGAITKQEPDGLVLVDHELCTGCKACLDACPFGVPQFGEDGIMQKCDLCIDKIAAETRLPCVETCPGNALQLKKLDTREKKEHQDYILRLLG